MKLMAIDIANSDEKSIVDSEDYPLLSRYSWSFGPKGYVQTNAFGTTVKIHRMILNAPKDKQVDHINGNKLDNRKCNLRLCTNSENQRNRPKHPTKKTSSKYKGVHFRKDLHLYVARIGINNRRIHLGQYFREEEAANAYNEAAYVYHGEFAKLNKIVKD